MKKRTRIKSLRSCIAGFLILTALFQMGIFFGALYFSGTGEKLDQTAIKGAKETVSSQGSQLESRMVRWSAMDAELAEEASLFTAYKKESGKTTAQIMENTSYQKELLKKLLPFTLQLMRSKESTGAFVILEGGNTTKESLYLRDLYPDEFYNGVEDVLAEAGPGEMLMQSGFTLDSNWSSKLKIQEESEFYQKPFHAAERYKGRISPDNLGYWSGIFRLHAGNIEQMTYSVPLIDEGGVVYGVMGIEVSRDYMETLLNGRAIVEDKNAAIILARSMDSKDYESQVVTGGVYKARFPFGTVFSMSGKSDVALYGVVQEGKVSEDSLIDYYPLRLYNTNTPFEKEEWIVGGIVDRDNILANSRIYMARLFLASILSLIVGILVSVALSAFVSRPIHKMIGSIHQMDGKRATLSRTGIREFDELALEMEEKNANIWENAFKIANIIEMTGLGIGVFEYDRSLKRNLCTERILDIFGWKKEETSWQDNYVDSEELGKAIEEVKEMLVPDKGERYVYAVKRNGKKDTWIRMKRVGGAEKYLCVVLDITDEIHEKRKITYERDHDVLTNLLNRRAFANKVTEILTENPDTKGVMSIWDLDNLKFVNDTYGHNIGDLYIKKMADSLNELQGEKSLVARMSGDEFMIFLYDENPIRLTEKLRDFHRAFMKEKIILDDQTTFMISASAGMAVYPKDASDYVELSKMADFAMYEVKNHEKGAIKLFNRESYIRDYIMVQGVGELDRILREKDIYYVFQPIVDVREKKVFAYEALLRTNSEILKGPQELIRLAESQSKLGKIEQITWEMATAAYFNTHEEITEKLFINSIPNQILPLEIMENICERLGKQAELLVLEVIEINKSNKELEKRKYEDCERLHIQIALDDYGTGYSNNDVLISHKLDYVKIDKTLIRDIHKIPTRQNLVQGLITYCHENHMKVIAEGVELKEELQLVMKLGVDYVQGFYLGRPEKERTDITEKLRLLLEEIEA